MRSSTQVPLMSTFLSVTKFYIILTFYSTLFENIERWHVITAAAIAAVASIFSSSSAKRHLSEWLVLHEAFASAHILHGTVFELNEIN